MRFGRNLARQGTIVVLATLFALGLYQLWDLTWRWFLVGVGAIAMVAIAMCFAAIFADFVLVGFFFAMPLASFDKWFFPHFYSSDEKGNLVYGGLFGLGLLDFVLIALYLTWFYRIFVARIQPLPRLYFVDLIVAGSLLVHFLGTIGAQDTFLAYGAIEYLLKHLMFYFYLSRNLRPAHLPWLVAAICFAIVGEAGFGAYQHFTGKLVGFALDKGAGSASNLSYQYSIPGLGSTNRATGTLYDSHAFGNYMGMLLPFPYILFMTPWMRPFLRWFFALVTTLGGLALVLSYSRSAWVATAIALVIGTVLAVIMWREATGIVVASVVAFFAIGTSPWTVKYIYDRFANSPIGTLTSRFKQYKVAFTIWQRFPFFGTGPNNYLNALKRYDYLWLKELPVHDVMLQILAENGLFGLCCYLALIFSVLMRLFKTAWSRKDLAGRLAMAAFIGVFSGFLDGFTDPLFREPTVFVTFWVFVSLAVALPTFARDDSVATGAADGRQAA